MQKTCYIINTSNILKIMWFSFVFTCIKKLFYFISNLYVYNKTLINILKQLLIQSVQFKFFLIWYTVNCLGNCIIDNCTTLELHFIQSLVNKKCYFELKNIK